jgi:serine/threonine protein kinase
VAGSPPSSEKEVTSIRPGDVLAGKYRVERVLGVGGMAVVVLARNVQLDELVALKLLHKRTLSNRTAVERFLREARSAAKIKNEHVARVIDVGALADGAPFMVMEYLEGRDLAAWLTHRGPMSVECAVDFVIQALEGVAEAHALNIVHRDLKPANLFCIPRPDGPSTIKVLDFGISKVIHPELDSQPITRTRDLLGSPLYMSPEQMQRARDVDSRSDIWSIGIILFELMTGQPPFLGETSMELAIKAATEPTPSMRSRDPRIPALLEAVVSKCLEKDPRRRYENVAELAVALAPFASPEGSRGAVDRINAVIRASRVTNPAAMSQMSDTREPTWGPVGPNGMVAPLGHTADRRRSRGAPTYAVIGVVLLCVGIGVAAFVRRSSREPSWSSAAPLESAPPPPATETEPVAAVPTAGLDPLPPLLPARPSASPPVSPQVHRPADCFPPYTVDDQGRKHFKRECITK